MDKIIGDFPDQLKGSLSSCCDPLKLGKGLDWSCFKYSKQP
ncbi:MAG: hypothetical protein QG552_2209 [Thermodesulfobacteriota bacterium]|nr:hypothetical protein [Thermodesulfobacteriota bacterium]